MITSVQDFVKYFKSIRRRTLNYVETIPPVQIDWQPAEGRFTCGDLVRHLSATEKMYVDVMIDNHWLYSGHEKGEIASLEDVIENMNRVHEKAMEKLATLDDADLNAPREAAVASARPVKAWRWLMAMVEHEVHHRSELASYLTIM
jgi:uncharacterized damage-inducible protein DinB